MQPRLEIGTLSPAVWQLLRGIRSQAGTTTDCLVGRAGRAEVGELTDMRMQLVGSSREAPDRHGPNVGIAICGLFSCALQREVISR